MEPNCLRAFVFGATGATGKAVVTQLLKNQRFSEVVCFVRRPVTISVGEIEGSDCQEPFPEGGKLRQIATDFQHLEDFEEEFKKGADVGFCSLGSTIKKAGSQEDFFRIDHDYVVGVASASLEHGHVRYFSYVSSIGADSSSSNFYLKTKGQVEDSLKNLKFQHLSIFRPGLLITEREEYRLGESIAQKVFPLISWMLPKRYQEVRVEQVAQSMIRDSLSVLDGAPPAEPQVRLFDNADIFRLLKDDPL